jgi:hypothetical protein
MKTKLQFAALAAQEPASQTASLRAGAMLTGVDVDEEKGLIRNAAILTIGKPQGYSWDVDKTTLAQTAALLNARAGGTKVRFKHPPKNNDGYLPEGLGMQVGVVLPGVRIEGDTLRGDVQLGEYAKNLPGLGDVRTYLLQLAKEHPMDVGLSAVIGFTVDPQRGTDGKPLLPARVYDCDAVDFVGTPAGNPNGLLAAGEPKPNQPNSSGMLPGIAPTGTGEGAAGAAASLASTKGVQNMDPKLKARLISEYGLSPSSTDEQAQAFFNSLAPERKGADGVTLAAKAPPAPAPAVAVLDPEDDDDDDDAKFIAREKKRTGQLAQLGAMLKVPDALVQQHVGLGSSIKDARTAFLEHVKTEAKPLLAIKVGDDQNFASLCAAMPDAILLRGNVKVDKPHERAQKLRGQGVIDMGRHFLSAAGVKDAYELSRMRIAELLLSGRELRRHNSGAYAMLAESTSDFSSILADTINKTLRNQYQDAPKTWPTWAKMATNPDFKQITRAALSEAPTLVKRTEGGEIKYSTFTDAKETYQLAEYVSGVKITRQAMINDDLGAFTSTPQKQINACARLEDDLAYQVLTVNANMNDGVALFHATHSNLIAAGGGAPTVATLAATEKLLKKQKGPKGAARLELRARFLLVPTSIYRATQQLISSQVDPAKNNAAQNPFFNEGIVIVPSARLDDASAVVWYLMTDYRDGQVDTAEVCFLDDETQPVARQETEFDTEDVKFAIRHTVAAKAIDWRGMVQNPGQ